MTEIEKMKRYIERTGVKYPDGTPYQMVLREWGALANMESRADAICLAFEYGRAKGYRAAKAEVRR